MKIIEPSVELIDDIDGAQILRKLERCGRVSRKSKPRNFVAEPLNDSARNNANVDEIQVEPRKSVEELRNEAAESFVRSIIKRGHESVLEHVSLTFHIVCDRAIMAELTRHRLASFTVESTRYVNYKDGLTVIAPDFDGVTHPDRSIRVPAQVQRSNWYEAVQSAEDSYLTCLTGGEYYEGCGMPPEQARAVLPLCTATELYMTANLRELRTILKLRCAKNAHPQMRVIACAILSVLHEKLPVVVEDIWELHKNDCDSNGS